MVNVIVWLIVGGIIGWVASMTIQTNAQQRLLLNVVVGHRRCIRGGLVPIPAIWD